jgi:molybdopterin-binding protein
MNLSARNVLKGRVKEIAHGAVNTEVTIELPGGTEIGLAAAAVSKPTVA